MERERERERERENKNKREKENKRERCVSIFLWRGVSQLCASYMQLTRSQCVHLPAKGIERVEGTHMYVRTS